MINPHEIRGHQREIKSNNSHIEQEIKRLEFQKNKLLGKLKLWLQVEIMLRLNP